MKRKNSIDDSGPPAKHVKGFTDGDLENDDSIQVSDN